MPEPDSTAWELLEAAASGSPPHRTVFVERYEPMIREWLASRWRASALAGQIDDVVQEVFLQCFKPHGVLQTAVGEAVGSFRAFLLGTIRHIAIRQEEKLARRKRLVPMAEAELDEQPGKYSSVSPAIDREWARSIVREAADRLGQRAARLGDSARARVEILRLRFQEDLSIAEIARRLEKQASWVHHQYAKARSEFRTVLEELLRERLPERGGDPTATCVWLMDLLR